MYFGLKFFHLKGRMDRMLNRIPFSLMKDQVASCDKLLKVIRDDMKQLQASKVGKKDNWCANGSFRLFSLPGMCIYVYQHDQHAACSSTYFSHLESTSITIRNNRQRYQICTDHPHHDHLEPYFRDNFSLVQYFEEALAGGRCNVQPQLETLRDIMAKKKTNNGTVFECPDGPMCNWSENDWTVRLVKGIETTCPKVCVTYSAEMGASFSTKVLRCLRVGGLIDEKCYLFRGAPDILIHHNRLVCTAGTTEYTSGSDDEAIENSHQRPPLTGNSAYSLPEKLGEIIAALHILLTSKIVRKMSKGKNIIGNEFEVKGLLLDKLGVVMHCSLRVNFSDNEEAALNVELKDYSGTMLTPASLCYQITSLIK